MWVRPKGTKSHKAIGKAFVVLMLIAAISAIFIREINNGSFSFIHLFVPLTFLGVYHAISRIRRKDVRGNRKAVKEMFFGALLIRPVNSKGTIRLLGRLWGGSALTIKGASGGFPQKSYLSIRIVSGSTSSHVACTVNLKSVFGCANPGASSHSKFCIVCSQL